MNPMLMSLLGQPQAPIPMRQPWQTPGINPDARQPTVQQPTPAWGSNLTSLLGNPMFRAGVSLLGTKDKRNALNNALQGLQGASDFQTQQSMLGQKKLEDEQRRKLLELQTKKAERSLGDYRPATEAERAAFGVPESYGLVIGPDGRPTTLGGTSAGSIPAGIQRANALAMARGHVDKEGNPVPTEADLQEGYRALDKIAEIPFAGGVPTIDPRYVQGLQGGRTAAEEGGRQAVRAQTEPQIAADVARAKAGVATEKAIAEEDRSNKRAFDTYQTAMSEFAKAAGAVGGGPITGWLPAVTADAQLFEGFRAQVTPLLKSMFRTAGEGTFTDKDQELLENMIPKRTDLPEVRARKIIAMDNIIRRKLGMANQQSGDMTDIQIRAREILKQRGAR